MYALCKSDSAYPELWDGLRFACCPEIGTVSVANIGLVRSSITLGLTTADIYQHRSPYGVASEFSGIGDYIKYDGDMSWIADHNPLSVFQYFETDAISTNRYNWGMGTNSLGNCFRMRLDHTASGQARLEVNGSYIRGTSNLNNTGWHGVLATLDGSDNWPNSGAIYVDGVPELDATNGGSRALTLSGGNDFVIGARDDALGSIFDGKILITILWSRRLGFRESQILHRDPLAPFRFRKLRRGVVPLVGGTNYSDIFGSTIFGGSVVA